MRYLNFFPIAICCLLAPVAAAQMSPNDISGKWSFVGPKNVMPVNRPDQGVGYIAGWINDVAYDPAVPTTIYAAAAGGGVWKSTDAGVTWSSMSDGWPTQMTSCIAIDPKNHNTIYVGTGNSYRYPTAASQTEFGAIPRNPDQAGFASGIMKSTDGGAHWFNIAGPVAGAPVQHILIDPDDSNRITAVLSDNQSSSSLGNPANGIYQSVNAGFTWVKRSLPVPGYEYFAPQDISVGVADKSGVRAYWVVGTYYSFGTPNYAVYSSLDRGASWSFATLPNSVGAPGVLSVSASPTNPLGAYIFGASVALATPDLGGTWNPVGIAPGWFSALHQRDSCIRSFLNSSGKDDIYVGLQTLGFTGDSGQTWVDEGKCGTSSAFIHEYVHNIARNPQNPTQFLLATDGGVYSYDSSSNTFKSLNQNLAVFDSTSLDIMPKNANYLATGSLTDEAPVAWGDLQNWVDLGPSTAKLSTENMGPVFDIPLGKTFVADGPPTGASWIFSYANGNKTAKSLFTSQYSSLGVSFPGTVTPDGKGLWISNTSEYYQALVSYDLTNSTWVFQTFSDKEIPNGFRNTFQFSKDGSQFYIGCANGSQQSELFTQFDPVNPSWIGVADNYFGGIGPYIAYAVSPTNPLDVLLALQSEANTQIIRGAIGQPSTWVRVTPLPTSDPRAITSVFVNAIAFDPINPNTTWYVATDVGVFETTNGGAFYQNMNPAGLPNTIVTDIKASAEQGVLYATTLGRGVWKIPLAKAVKGYLGTMTLSSLVTGGSDGAGTITLSTAAPAGGLQVFLTPNIAFAATFPTSVTVPAGKKTVAFTYRTNAVPFDTNVWLTAMDEKISISQRTMVLKPQPDLSVLRLNATSVVGGNPVTGKVSLKAVADTFGTPVALTSSSAAIPPITVLVPAGQTAAGFTLPTIGVTASLVVTVTAKSGNVAKTASITVQPAALTSLSLSASTVVGGAQVVGTLKMNGLPPVKGISVALASDSAAVTVPATVTALHASTTFNAQTTGVSASTVATVTASFAGVNATAKLTVNPASLLTMGLSATSAVGAAPLVGTVYLNGLAGPSGAVVALSSSDKVNASVPANVTVTSGTSSATYSVTTKPVDANEAISITAVYGAVTKIKSFTLLVPSLASVTLSSPKVTGGTSVNAVISMNGKTGPSGLSLNILSSNVSVASVPAAIKIAPGSISGTFTVTTRPVSVETVLVIKATFGKQLATATLTVEP